MNLETRPELGIFQAGLRLRRLQHIVANAGADALLLVAGVDGRYNMGSAQAIAHLLHGISNRDAADNCHLSADLSDSVILVTRDGLLAYVPSCKAAEEIQDLLSETTANIQIFRPTEAESADPDAVEECKIGSFVQMLRGLQTLAIPWIPPSEEDAKDRNQPSVMELEKWPLLQALGLEGVGRQGFFTQNFKVVDVYSQLQEQVYGQVDGHAMEHAMAEAAATLQQHWVEMIKVLGQKAPGPAAAELTERQLAEPLVSYFSYGMLRPAPGVAQAVTMMPKVLVGARTNDDAAAPEPLRLGSAPGPAPGLPALHMVAEAADGRGPLRAARTYFLSQGSLTRDHLADLDEEQEEGYSFEAATRGWSAEDAVLLMRLYTAVVAAARAAMEHFALQEGATVMSARAVAMDCLAQQCEALGVTLQGLAGQARFALWECDHVNVVKAAAVRGSRKLKVLRLAIHDIHSRSKDHAGALLGAVAYADTFMEVPALGSRPAQLLNLTEGLPAITASSALGQEAAAASRASRSFSRLAALSPASALASGEEVASAASAARAAKRSLTQRKAAAAAAKAATRLHRAAALAENGKEDGQDHDEEQGEEEEREEEEQELELELEAAAAAAAMGTGVLGSLLTLGGGEEALLLTGAGPCPATPGSLWCFTSGLVFIARHSHAMWVLPFLGQLEAITVQELRGQQQQGQQQQQQQQQEQEQELEAIGEAVVLRGQAPACGLPPACHLTTNKHLALPLAGMTQSGRKHMLSVVLPAWQKACRDSSSTPDAVQQPISYLKDPSAGNPFPAQQYTAMLSSVQLMHVDGKAWPAMVLQDRDVEELVARLDKAELCAGLGPLDDAVEQLLLRPAASSGSSLAVTLLLGVPGAEQALVASSLCTCLGQEARPMVAVLPGDGGVYVGQAHVDAALQAVLQQQQGRGHAVLAACCYDGVVPLLQLLASSPAVKAGRVHLASVICCVCADMVLQEPGRDMVLPGIMGQLAPGYVDALVLAPGSSLSADVAKVQALLQRRNPSAPLLRGSRAVLLRAKDDLLPPAAERQQRLREQADLRRWSAPRSPGGQDQAAPLCAGPLQAVRLGFQGELDLTALRAQLQQAGLPCAASAEPVPLTDVMLGPGRQQLVAVQGLVRQAGQAALPVQELQASRQAGLRSRDWHLGGLALVHGLPEELAQGVPGGELLLVGSGLRPDALRALLERCGKGAGLQPKQLRKPESLTAEERAVVAKARTFDPLPEGYCFDGTRYRDEFGDVLPQHPYMDRFIAECVAQQNEQIEADNASLAAAAQDALTVKQVRTW